MTHRYALVTLVMRGDRYIPGARVLGRSARDHLTSAQIELVCMVTADVSEPGRALLQHEFDHVIEVPVITAKYVKTNAIFDSKYGAWISDSYTKWNCLGLHRYRRVAFFDADCLVLADVGPALMDEAHIDRAAGVFSNSWSHTVMSLTPERIDPTKSPMIDEYAQHVGMNARDVQVMPRSCLRSALDGPLDFSHSSPSPTSAGSKARWTGMRFVCAGSSIMFQPFLGGDQLFRQHLPRLTRPNPRCGGSGPDDQSIVRFLLEYHPVHSTHDWQFLHAGWCFIPWKQALLHSQGLDLSDGIIQHYFNVNKPWESVRSDWPDLESWWQVHDRLVVVEEEQKVVVQRPPTPNDVSRFYQLMSWKGSWGWGLRELLKTQLRRYPRLHEQLWQHLNTLVPKQETTPPPSLELDETIYSELRQFYHQHLLTKTTAAARAKSLESMEVGASEGRAEYRALQVKQYVCPGPGSSLTVVDIGCGNGSITEQLALQLGPVHAYHGVDLPSVIPPASGHRVQYVSVMEGGDLPFADGSVDVATALMSLHHMRDLDHKLSELARVTRVGGQLIVREHDAPPGDVAFRALLDVMHGLYSRVWPAVPECERFVDTYYGEYRSRAAWREVVERHGQWRRSGGTAGLDGGSMGRFYWDVWVRVTL